jgi:hypothetical protein
MSSSRASGIRPASRAARNGASKYRARSNSWPEAWSNPASAAFSVEWTAPQSDMTQPS